MDILPLIMHIVHLNLCNQIIINCEYLKETILKNEWWFINRIDKFSIGSLGINQLFLDIFLRCVSLFIFPKLIIWRTGPFSFCLFQWVYIIRRFTKCCKVNRENWVFEPKYRMTVNIFENWFVSMFRLKSTRIVDYFLCVTNHFVQLIMNIYNFVSRKCEIFIFRFSWFLGTANAYSAFVWVVLISSTIFSACVVFQIDLVRF